MTNGKELNHWDYAHGKAIIFPYGPGSWRICSFMAWMDRYLLDLCTLDGVHLDYTKGFSTDTSYIFCEQHGNIWLLEDAYSFLGTWDSHICHCNKKMWSPFLVSIRKIRNFMLAGEGSCQGFGPTLKIFIICYKDPHTFNFALEVLIL